MSDMTIWDSIAKSSVQPGLRVGRYLSLQQRYDEWVQSPDGRFVFDHIRAAAFRLARDGWTHYGIATLWEQARYSRDVQVGPNAGFKLNNDFRSRMARHLMNSYPNVLGDFFEVRRLTA